MQSMGVQDTPLDLLFSRTRARLFRELFNEPGREIHLRQLARQCGVAVGTLQDEAGQLLRSGLLRTRREGNRLFFKAHEGHPLFPEIHRLVRKAVPVKPPLKKIPGAVPDPPLIPATVRAVLPADRRAWLRMRQGLWPGHTDHPKEITAYFSQPRFDAVVLVAELPGGGLAGFLELGLRDYAEGCTTSPAAYIEGWWVEEKHRRKGIGRALVRGAETWVGGHGLSELGSDCTLDNLASAAAHRACGFTETDRIVCFLKTLPVRYSSLADRV